MQTPAWGAGPSQRVVRRVPWMGSGEDTGTRAKKKFVYIKWAWPLMFGSVQNSNLSLEEVFFWSFGWFGLRRGLTARPPRPTWISTSLHLECLGQSMGGMGSNGTERLQYRIALPCSSLHLLNAMLRPFLSGGLSAHAPPPPPGPPPIFYTAQTKQDKKLAECLDMPCTQTTGNTH